MHTLRQTIGLFALAIAAIGPMPLWLHHEIAHSSECCLSELAENSSDHSDHTHSQQSAEPESETLGDGFRSAEVADSCAICFALSQETVDTAFAAPSHSEPLVSECISFSPSFLKTITHRANRPRGPPCIS